MRLFGAMFGLAHWRRLFRLYQGACHCGEFLQQVDHSFQFFDFGQWFRGIFQTGVAVCDAPDRKVAHGLGLDSELWVNWQKPRGEIVQVVSAAERFGRKHEQGLDQLFRSLRHMIRTGPQAGEVLRGDGNIDVFLDDRQP